MRAQPSRPSYTAQPARLPSADLPRAGRPAGLLSLGPVRIRIGAPARGDSDAGSRLGCGAPDSDAGDGRGRAGDGRGGGPPSAAEEVGGAVGGGAEGELGDEDGGEEGVGGGHEPAARPGLRLRDARREVLRPGAPRGPRARGGGGGGGVWKGIGRADAPRRDALCHITRTLGGFGGASGGAW